jgi:hypothetical protein
MDFFAHKTPSYDTKMRLMVGFDEKANGKFRIIALNKTLMKHIKSNQKLAYGFKILKKEIRLPKV